MNDALNVVPDGCWGFSPNGSRTEEDKPVGGRLTTYPIDPNFGLSLDNIMVDGIRLSNALSALVVVLLLNGIDFIVVASVVSLLFVYCSTPSSCFSPSIVKTVDLSSVLDFK